MARDGRGGVVSVRISESDQQRLRRIAETRGTSVSDLVRSAALREVGEVLPPTVTVTMVPSSQVPEIGRGLIWDVPAGAHVVGNTVTF